MTVKHVARRVGFYFAVVPVAGLIFSYIFNYYFFGDPMARGEWAYFPLGIALAPVAMAMQSLAKIFPTMVTWISAGRVAPILFTAFFSIVYFCVGYYSACGIGVAIKKISAANKSTDTAPPLNS